ncbi:hypothetical protein SAMN05444350_11095 [Bacteroides stercorirosoris]|jgi:hypothetical protein|uniref:Uncharacterized protein n=1 Tax=Bacteroides stercorirosoris TaxID=871324 RepID=A0A1M6EVU5_9BACE|nr:hypothetical protein SAMN05444350_11095 [Bacteroides stercorirosoris]
MKTKFDYYYMSPLYEFNYVVLFFVKLYNRIKQRKTSKVTLNE